MESVLTKRIKELTHYYNPKMNPNMRTIRWADEVWTPTGIVDSIRFEDYCGEEEYLCNLINFDRFPEKVNRTRAYFHNLGKCFRDESVEMNDKKCHGCVERSHLWKVDMLTTCYEVKISYSDFLSKNGHNFHGNENYYCVPKELAKKIEHLVPEDVGILTYFEGKKQYGLRKFKPSGWRDVPDSVKVSLLYNAMKKWCDGAVWIK